MEIYLNNSNNFANFGAWIGRSCKPSDKGKLTVLPHFTICQQNLVNVSNMLNYEELPQVNSERWLSLENLKGEEWRDIVGLEGSYKVSNYGRIKGCSRIRNNNHSSKVVRERIRRLSANRKGYLVCNMTFKCKKVSPSSVSRIVAIAFLPNPNNKPEVDHISTITTDNRVCNLRWVTGFENAHNPITEKRVQEARAKQIGTHYTEETRKKISEGKKGGKNPMYGLKGDRHPRSKAVVQLTLDGVFVREWTCAREASKVYGTHITDCCKGNRSQCGGYKWAYKNN